MGWNYCITVHPERVVIRPQANQHLNSGLSRGGRGESTEQRKMLVLVGRGGGEAGTDTDTDKTKTRQRFQGVDIKKKKSTG